MDSCKYKDYEFKVGDKVITKDGESGKIVGICDCEMCKERGFYELIWKKDGDNHLYDYITNYDAENDFAGYYMIGNYRFNDFDKDIVFHQIIKHEFAIRQLKNQLKLIRSFEEYDEGDEYEDDWTTKACIEMGR